MKKTKRIRLPLSLILEIAIRDGFQCNICHLGYLLGDTWEIEHDVCLFKGGRNLLTNMRLAHRSCNLEKGIA